MVAQKGLRQRIKGLRNVSTGEHIQLTVQMRKAYMIHNRCPGRSTGNFKFNEYFREFDAEVANQLAKVVKFLSVKG
jgi:hypothetical protein